jgi:hypothetical protein
MGSRLYLTSDFLGGFRARDNSGLRGAIPTGKVQALPRASRAASGGAHARDRKILHRPHMPMLHENSVRTGFFERDQFDAVLRSLPEEVQPVA